MGFRDTDLQKDELTQIAQQTPPPAVSPVIQASMPMRSAPAVMQSEVPFVPTPTAQFYPAEQQQQVPQGNPYSVSSTTQQTITDPAIKEGIVKLQRDQAAAVAQQAQAEVQTNDMRMMAYGEVAKEVQEKKSNYEAAVNELKGKKIVDPHEKWGTGKKIGAAIAMGLGAYAASYTGSKNYAADIIDNAINRDIALQEQEIKKLGANVDESKNALAFAYRKFGDLDQAKSAIQMAALINAKEDIINTAKNVDNAQAEARKKSLLTAMDAKILELQSQTQDKQIISTTISKPAMEKVKPTTASGLTPAEENEALQFEESMKSVLRSFDDMAAMGYWDRGAWNMIGGNSEAFEAKRSGVGAVLAEKLKQRSDADWKTIMLPTLPGVKDTPATLKQKREGVINTLMGYAPAGWLKSKQLTPKNDASKLKSQYGFKPQ